MKKYLIISLALIMLPFAADAARRNKEKVTPVVMEENIADDDSTFIDEPLSFDEMDIENESLPDGIQVRYENDTLFFTCSQEALPRHIVVMAADGELLYKQLPLDTLTMPIDHPASDLYSDIWTNTRVNPYNTPIDSIKDSVIINTTGFCLPYDVRPQPNPRPAGYVTSRFGFRRYRFHYGTDIKVQVGDSIRAAWDGQVRIVGWDPRGYGHYVVIRHDNGLETVYGHLSRPLFDENERIFAGEVLGLGGNTGRSTGSHLHLEIRYLGNAINPEYIIDFNKNELRDSAQYIITKKGTFSHKEELKQVQSAQYHTVRSGDTLSHIAKRYRTNVRTLCRLNNIKETTILQIGRRIRVK